MTEFYGNSTEILAYSDSPGMAAANMDRCWLLRLPEVHRHVNGLRYIFDHRYWCFAILNHGYAESLKNNDDIETFIKKFSKRKVMPGKKFGFFKLSEDERKIWVMLLSQKDFVKENFGKLPFTAGRHSEICRNWDEHLKQIPYGKE